MLVRCDGQSWYKYRMLIGTRVLIYRNLRDRVIEGGGWSDTHTGWTNPPVNNTCGSNQRTKIKN